MSAKNTPDEKRLTPYLDNVANFPWFTIHNDEVSQRIPATKIKSWDELPTLLRQPFFKDHQFDFVFRGQRRHDWALAPSLARYDKGIVRKANYEKQLGLFRHAVRARLNDYDLVDEKFVNELWSVGQHHGLATPLIDWTTSPYVALFFAFESPDVYYERDDDANQARVIYVLNKSYLQQEGVCQEIEIVQPKRDAYGRLVAQAGLFTVAPFDNTTDACLMEWLSENESVDVDVENFNVLDRGFKTPADYICKIYIPNESREDCLRFLRQMNVHHGSLFPDIIGASNYCNFLTQEYAAEQAKNLLASSITAVEETNITNRGNTTLEGDLQHPTTAESSPINSVTANSYDVYYEIIKTKAQSTPLEYTRLAARGVHNLFESGQYLDWPNSDSKKADLRIKARNVFRGAGFKFEIIEEVIDPVMELAKSRYKPPYD